MPAPIEDLDSRLARIFKAYDIRGTVPDELDEVTASFIGAAFARFVSDEGHDRVLVGRDMRRSGVELSRGFIGGVRSEGLAVVNLGLCSTDLVYFASGYLAAPAAMLTASHNPARYNGIKLCLAGASPIGEASGLRTIQKLAGAIGQAAEGGALYPGGRGAEQERDLLAEFVSHAHSFIDTARLAPLSIVADTANGMGGLTAPRVFAGLPPHLDLLYGELDGTFPNHPADPIQAENLVDLARVVREKHADVGLAFDGDADRVFLLDELGEPLSGSLTTAIVADAMLKKFPHATVLYNCICSKAVPEVIEEHGGKAIRTRVGHSYIKAVMAETGAVFGGEHSGHYYFRDNWRADSGIIAALVVLEALSASGVPLSVLRRSYERYADSPEINTEVSDPEAVIRAVTATFTERGASCDLLDGLTADLGSWWFNLRPSNTEPLLRLNLEAADVRERDLHLGEVLALITEIDARRTELAPGSGAD